MMQKSYWWRGKVAGGTNTINTMIYMRGNKLDYDAWADSGNTGWSFEECLPYFKKLEDVSKVKSMAADGEQYIGPEVEREFNPSNRDPIL